MTLNSDIETYHVFFKKLSNQLRIRIISALRKKDMSVNELVKTLGVEQSKLSHALASLKCCNIVHSKIKGKQRIYSVNNNTIIPILDIIDRHEKTFCKHCPMRK